MVFGDAEGEWDPADRSPGVVIEVGRTHGGRRADGCESGVARARGGALTRPPLHLARGTSVGPSWRGRRSTWRPR